MFRAVILILCCIIMPDAARGQGQAQGYQLFIGAPVQVCEAIPGQGAPSDFFAKNCSQKRFYEVDPQDRELWVELIFEAAPSLLATGKPLGLFVSAKASSEAYLNGVALGSNGQPGPSPSSEIAGDMDAVFYVAEGALRTGENRLLLRMSSMHSVIALNSPVHNIALAPYRDPRKPGPGTWFVIVTFGLFLAAFVFFGVSAFRGKDRQGSALIALAAIAAAMQLASKSVRDLAPYPYPLHDLRLSLILAFSIILALSLFAYVLQLLFKPLRARRWLALSALFAVMLVIAAFQPGFDLKTQYVLVAASIASVIAGLVAGLGWAGFGIGRRPSRLVDWRGGRAIVCCDHLVRWTFPGSVSLFSTGSAVSVALVPAGARRQRCGQRSKRTSRTGGSQAHRTHQ